MCIASATHLNLVREHCVKSLTFQAVRCSELCEIKECTPAMRREFSVWNNWLARHVLILLVFRTDCCGPRFCGKCVHWRMCVQMRGYFEYTYGECRQGIQQHKVNQLLRTTDVSFARSWSSCLCPEDLRSNLIPTKNYLTFVLNYHVRVTENPHTIRPRSIQGCFMLSFFERCSQNC